LNTNNEVIDFLVNDEMSNINIINFIESYPSHHVEKIGDSILLRGTSDKDWVYISSKSEEDLKTIKNRLKGNDKNFAAIEEWMIPIITKDKKIIWKLSAVKLILVDESFEFDSKYTLTELTRNDADFIYENSDYKNVISIEYIIDRIIKGESSCIRYKGKPAAWAITQDDGAIGFLHVLPEFRRMGYGREVTMDLIKKVQKKNKIPFVHIEEKNEKSMSLAMNLGFMKDKVVSWFEIE